MLSPPFPSMKALTRAITAATKSNTKPMIHPILRVSAPARTNMPIAPIPKSILSSHIVFFMVFSTSWVYHLLLFGDTPLSREKLLHKRLQKLSSRKIDVHLLAFSQRIFAVTIGFTCSMLMLHTITQRREDTHHILRSIVTGFRKRRVALMRNKWLRFRGIFCKAHRQNGPDAEELLAHTLA